MRSHLYQTATFEPHEVATGCWVLKIAYQRWTRTTLTMEKVKAPETSFHFLYKENPTFLAGSGCFGGAADDNR